MQIYFLLTYSLAVTIYTSFSSLFAASFDWSFSSGCLHKFSSFQSLRLVFNHVSYFWFTCKLYLIAQFKVTVTCCTLFTAFTFNLRNLLHNYRLCALSWRIMCASTHELTPVVQRSLAFVLQQQSVISSLYGWLKFVIGWLLKINFACGSAFENGSCQIIQI